MNIPFPSAKEIILGGHAAVAFGYDDKLKIKNLGGGDPTTGARQKNDGKMAQGLRDLTRIQLVSHVEEMVELLAARAAGVLSYNALREDLQVALDSVRLWTEALIRLYYIYLVRPYAKRIARAIRREPKVYLWDWSEIEDDGRRFENLTANHLLKWCHFTRDFGLEPLELFYVRDKEKREVDFLLTKGGAPWLLIEAKLGASAPGPALGYFGDRLSIRNRFLIVADLKKPGIAGDVRILDATSFFAALPV